MEAKAVTWLVHYRDEENKPDPIPCRSKDEALRILSISRKLDLQKFEGEWKERVGEFKFIRCRLSKPFVKVVLDNGLSVLDGIGELGCPPSKLVERKLDRDDEGSMLIEDSVFMKIDQFAKYMSLTDNWKNAHKNKNYGGKEAGPTRINYWPVDADFDAMHGPGDRSEDKVLSWPDECLELLVRHPDQFEKAFDVYSNLEKKAYGCVPSGSSWISEFVHGTFDEEACKRWRKC